MLVASVVASVPYRTRHGVYTRLARKCFARLESESRFEDFRFSSPFFHPSIRRRRVYIYIYIRD